jgi:hypothetical protein
MAWDNRAMQFSVFPSPPWAFDPFPPGGGRLGWGEKQGEGKDGQARVLKTA